MLEGTSPRLTAPGGPHHYGCPDKEPQARLDTLAAAGAARVPFTTGEDQLHNGLCVCVCVLRNGEELQGRVEGTRKGGRGTAAAAAEWSSSSAVMRDSNKQQQQQQPHLLH